MTAAVQVLAIRPRDGRGTVKAFLDIQLGGVTVKGAKIVQQDGKPPWLAMPAIEGNHGWNSVVELSQPLRERVTEVVLEAWKTRQPGQQTPGGAMVDAAPYSRGRDDVPNDDRPWQRDTGDPGRPFDDRIPF